jgi:hypothetical protein
LYWVHETSGLVDRVVPDDVIAYFKSNPPQDTRAWTRAMLLRYADGMEVDSVNWDSIRFEIRLSQYWRSARTLRLPNPLEGAKDSSESAFKAAADLVDLLDRLEAPLEGSHLNNHRFEERKPS